MLHRTTTIAGVGVVGAIAIGAAVAAASQGSSRVHGVAAVTSGTVRTERADVAGKTETILTDAQGQPLYYYGPDSATESRVSGGLATVWPPVISAAAPSAIGLGGKLSVVRDSHGSQVAYNGHLLYTFVSDHGRVTGEGVQNFFVATPTLSSTQGSSSSGTSGGAYGGY